MKNIKNIDNQNILRNQRGNVMFMILLAIVLIGILSTVIMSSSDTETANIDDENMTIIVSKVQRQSAEFERAVNFILQSGYTETQIRFSHPQAHTDYGDLSADADKGDQVFSSEGGAATYRQAPAMVSNGDDWEFYGNSIIPSVGSDLPDLIAVLPNVTKQFCIAVNKSNGQPSSITDTGTCINTGSSARFRDAQQFGGATNAIPGAGFAQNATISVAKPALQACVSCGGGFHFYHVLLAR